MLVILMIHRTSRKALIHSRYFAAGFQPSFLFIIAFYISHLWPDLGITLIYGKKKSDKYLLYI
jgi:hypothetical protein